MAASEGIRGGYKLARDSSAITIEGIAGLVVFEKDGRGPSYRYSEMSHRAPCLVAPVVRLNSRTWSTSARSLGAMFRRFGKYRKNPGKGGR